MFGPGSKELEKAEKFMTGGGSMCRYSILTFGPVWSLQTLMKTYKHCKVCHKHTTICFVCNVWMHLYLKKRKTRRFTCSNKIQVIVLTVFKKKRVLDCLFLFCLFVCFYCVSDQHNLHCSLFNWNFIIIPFIAIFMF